MPHSSLSPSSAVEVEKPDWFGATHWSVVLAAGREDSPDRRAALETLCCSYWRPIFGYIRQRGYTPADAEDLTQSFFGHLLSHSWFNRARPGAGRFRGFLLVSLKHFLINETGRNRATKRGGDAAFVPLDEDRDAWNESTLRSGWREDGERRFDREWALTVMQDALRCLREDWSRRGKAEQFEQLRVFLTRDADADDHAELGLLLGIRSTSVPVVLHRLRRSYGDFVRERIAQTVATLAEVEDETRYLLELVGD